VLKVLPTALPSNSDLPTFFKNLPIGGIVLTGGNDLSRLTESPLSQKRDLFEHRLIDLGLRKKIPILGVCRGMQVLSEYFGARCEKVEGHAGTRHEVRIADDSVFKNQLSKMPTVNSYHNYGIKKPPQGFLASATSRDGVVEAFEMPSRRVYAQMWHPERENPFLPAQISLLKTFFKIS